MLMQVTSMRAAERRNSPHAIRNHQRSRAYVARLYADQRGVIVRDFVKREKSGDSRLVFTVNTQPGDIYEIRRWFWDGNRECFMGGMVWIGLDQANEPFMLTRDEACASARLLRVETTAPPSDVPAINRPDRILPRDILFHSGEGEARLLDNETLIP